jgi:hypothetical protein
LNPIRLLNKCFDLLIDLFKKQTDLLIDLFKKQTDLLIDSLIDVEWLRRPPAFCGHLGAERGAAPWVVGSPASVMRTWATRAASYCTVGMRT